MGTRGLTVAVLGGTHRIAQYGQWDHYPSGQGVTVLGFCTEWLGKPGGPSSPSVSKRAQFESALQRCRFVNDDDEREYKEWAASVGVKDGWMNMEQAAEYKRKFPLWNRDIGGQILDIVARSTEPVIVLQDQYEFAADSLLCEYAYVVDLDANKFEVYRGFNHKPPVGRFASLKVEEPEYRAQARADGRTTSPPYMPVTLLASFDFDNLPGADAFVELCDAEAKKLREDGE